jgi:biopolymer transport protein ExbD
MNVKVAVRKNNLYVMASIDTGGGDSGHKKGPGVKKAKKMSTRIDMTPLVDLGFLLITFFIFTTTMSTPSTMDLFMPKDTDKPEEQNKAKESGALTIMMGKDDHIYYYEGKLLPDASNFLSSNYKGIRDVIIKKKKTTAKDDLVIVLKPNKEATYKNTVDMLDEMTINGIKRFALVDISDVEDQLIQVTEGGGAPAPAAQPAAQ